MVAAKTSRKPQSMAENFAPSDSMAESSAQPNPGGCHGRVGRASATNAENACERFFWALQGVNFNVYGIVSASGDLVERYEYTPYGQRTVYSRGWLKCDLNGDGVVDSTDWDLYVYYRSHPQEGASIADYDGDGHVDMDGDGDRIDNQQGRSVADDPLVMHSRLESFRTDSQMGSAGGTGSLCDIGHQGLLHDKEFGPAATGLVHNRRRTLNPLLARFMQRDPKDSGRPSGGYHDGMSLYEYVQSRPHMENDAPGLGIAQRAGAGGGGIHQNGAGEWETTKDTVVYNDLPGDRPSGWQTAREIVDMRNQGTEWECLRGQKQARFVKVLGGRCINLGLGPILGDSAGNEYCAYLCNEWNIYKERQCSKQGRWERWRVVIRVGDIYIGALCYPPCAAIGKVLYKGDNGLSRLGASNARADA